MIVRWCWLFAVIMSLFTAASAEAAFHAMQIEQVIGGLNGDTSSQAIQLRLRQAGHNFVQFSSVWAADAANANRILLLNIASPVTNGSAGDRVLLTTSNFTQYMINNGAPTFAPDFTLTNPIPASYLSGGRLTFEQDGGSVATPGTIYWSLSWGSYSGLNTGDTFNDVDGNFGPKFGSALPTAGLQGVIFPGAASALSTTNAADYALSADPATVRNNARASFVIPALPKPGDYNGDGDVTIDDYFAWKNDYGAIVAAGTGADGNSDTFVNAADYTVWRNNYVGTAGSGQSTGGGQSLNETANVPEPAAIALLLSAIGITLWRRRPAVALCLNFDRAAEEHPQRWREFFGESLPEDVLVRRSRSTTASTS